MRYRRANEPYNKAEEMIIECIRRYPSLYRSRYDVLKTLLLTYCSEEFNPWVNGELVEEVWEGVEHKPYEVSREYAERIFEYGHMDHVTIIGCDWNKTAVIHYIPNDVKQEWLDLVEDLILYLVKFSEDDYRLHIESYMIKHYARNSVGFHDWYPRYMKCYDEALVGLDEIAEKHGWTYWMRSVYHAPETIAKRSGHMNELITEVLGEADETD